MQKILGKCPACHKYTMTKHGKYKGRQRWYCPACRSHTTGIATRIFGKPISRPQSKGTNYQLVVHIRTNNPEYTLQQVAEICDISRERVRQILKDAGMNTRYAHHYDKTYCNYCGKELTGATRFTRHFCNRECQHKASQVLLTCEVCGKDFYRSNAQVNRAMKRQKERGDYNHIFCSRQCFGVYLGNNHGFKTNHGYINRWNRKANNEV